MGSCISKCRFCGRCPEETGHVQDKLVISQAPATPPPPPPLPLVPNKVSLYPPPSPPPSSSSSSLSCTSSKQTCSSSSSSSSSTSAAPYPKDKVLFSNEFLWSCYQENPHVLLMSSLKETASSSSILKTQKSASSPPHSVPQRLHKSTPQKRIRPSSLAPALTRQKSFRKEPPEKDSPLWPSSLPNRTMRSPSPSRRFNGGVRESYSSRQMVGSTSSSSRKENLIPGYHQSPRRSNAMNRETSVHRISSKINERAVTGALSNQDVNSITPEVDMENPLISLDCFIFV